MSVQLLQNAVMDRPISREQAEELLEGYASGATSPEILAAALTALRIRGEHPQTLLGFAQVLRRHMIPVALQGLDAIDLCGTGGDGQGTVNLSTAAAFVVAGAGVPVAKHGNHGVSSPTGSADVLAALGVPLQRDPALAARCFQACGLTFLYAPAHHPLFARLSPLRRQLGFRTAFNLLGPLCNPAGVRRQVLGAPSLEAMTILAEVLCGLGCDQALVVHTPGPYDEVTLTVPAQAIRIQGGRLASMTLAPADFGTTPTAPAALKGGEASLNAERILEVLGGVESDLARAVCANAACGLWIAGAAADPREAYALATRTLWSGRALAKLQALRAFFQEVGHDLAG